MKLMDLINLESDNLFYKTHVDLRKVVNLIDDEPTDIFIGCFEINKAGLINSLDGDRYSKDMEIYSYEIKYDHDGAPYLECYEG